MERLRPLRVTDLDRESRSGEAVNCHGTGESRAERYVVDESARTARPSQAYLPAAGTRATLGGTTQELADQHLLVAYGDGGAVRPGEGLER
jgi:hypothetical protein